MGGERANPLKINSLRRGCQPSEPHVFDHLRAQRCHQRCSLSSSPEVETNSRPSKQYPRSIHPATVPQPATAKPFSPTSFMLHYILPSQPPPPTIIYSRLNHYLRPATNMRYLFQK